ncbi:MAG: hypothetical protein ACM3Q4_16700 [Acidobacteriota bacterium]
MRLDILILSGLLLVFSACKDKSIEPKEDNRPVGRGDSTWFYSFQQPYSPIDTFRIDFLGTTTISIEGRAYPVLKQSGGYYVDSSELTNLYWEGPDGLYRMGIYDSYDTLYTKILTYKYPVHAGDTYEYRMISISPADTYYVSPQILTMKVIAVDTLITTPAGTFKCNQYQYTKRPVDDVAEFWQYNLYYAPGIGLIAGHTVSAKSGSMKQDYRLIKREHYH